MADWYVSPSGDDTTGDGSELLPYKHIYKAWQELADGDTIYLYDGTYDEEDTPLVAVNKGFKIKSISEDYQKVIIIPTAMGNTSVGGFYAWIGGNTNYLIQVFDCTLILDYSVITTGYTTYNGLVFGYKSSGDVTSECIRCFLIGKNLPDGTNFYGLFGIGVPTGTSKLKAIKCTFRGWKNNDMAAGVSQYDGYLPLQVIDCIFEGCSRGIIAQLGYIEENNNCFYNNTYDIRRGTTNVTIDSTDITTDPDFTSADGAEVPSSSPCVDAGVLVTGYITDFHGEAPDMGCDEDQAQILIFTGTYNEGSSTGTVNLSERVMNIGAISEVLVSTNSSPWCQKTSVVLDDSDGYFIGTLARGTEWYDGTFNIWAEHGTAWEQLLTGYVPTASWSYDYSKKLATINVTSMLAKSAALSMGFGGTEIFSDGNTGSTVYSMFRSLFFEAGTITAINDGTVTAEKYQAGIPWPPVLNSRFWSDLDTPGTVDTGIQAAAILESYDGWAESSGTWAINYRFSGGTKDWMSAGNALVLTVPFPSSWASTTNISWLFEATGSRMGLEWDATNWDKFKADLEIVPLSYTPMYGTRLYTGFPASLGTAPLYYGGQMWVEVMNDLMNSVGANWTVDGVGKIRAKIKRASAAESVVGTLDFADAERAMNESWNFNETEGLSVVSVYHEWNNYEQQFDGTAQTEGSMNTGAILKVNAKWQRDLGGKLLADRTMTWEQTICRVFPLPFPKEHWGSCIPGSLISLINVPAAIAPIVGTDAAPLIAEGKYTIQARHYDYDNGYMIADLRQSPPLTNVFILDYSELDGPDLLY